MDVTFRRLTDDDLPMLHRWLNEPGVVEWWEGDDVSWEAVVRDYGTPSSPSLEHWISIVDGVDTGWIQCYAAVDDLEESAPWFDHGVTESAAGIDYLVGEPVERGKGVGSAIIRAFTTDVVFGRHPDWTQSAASPFEANAPSWRALEKAGYRYRATVEYEDGRCRLMVAERADFTGRPVTG